MPLQGDLRRNELMVPWQEPSDANLVFIGRIRTPWTSRTECPHYGTPEGPLCRIEVDEPWAAALDGIEAFERIEVLYWLHESRRDLIRQSPADNGRTKATFTIRSPIRPNPIGTAVVTLFRRAGPVLEVRGLDCVDGTPLLDLKPDRSEFAAARSAAARPAERQE
jgi:tRNA (adenine37-N6)-methyltransferase